jgi:hypothetical protein
MGPFTSGVSKFSLTSSVALASQGRIPTTARGESSLATSFMMWWSSRDSSNEYSSISSDWGNNSALGDRRVLTISISGISPFSSSLNW